MFRIKVVQAKPYTGAPNLRLAMEVLPRQPALYGRAMDCAVVVYNDLVRVAMGEYRRA